MSPMENSTALSVENAYICGQYYEQNPSWHSADSPWKAQQIASMIDRNRLAPQTICEVGCGAGEVLVQLHRQLPAGVEFFGYEISPLSLRSVLAAIQRTHSLPSRFHAY